MERRRGGAPTFSPKLAFESQKGTQVKDHVIKRLFSKSAGMCNMCQIDVIEEKVVVGEMAHVIAKSGGGPRGDLPFAGDLNSYENLILLCANHHLRVDGDPDGYPPAKLHLLKATHENWVASRLRPHSKRDQDIAGLQGFMRHFPFVRVPSMLEQLPHTSQFELVAAADQFYAFTIDFPLCNPFSDAGLEISFQTFAASYRKLVNLLNGTTPKSYSRYGETITRGRGLIQHINPLLDYAERSAANTEVQAATNEVSATYGSLLTLLRTGYREVDLDSYTA